jgi:iron(III) transport system permease protein
MSMLIYGSLWSGSRITEAGHLTIANFLSAFREPLVIETILNSALVGLGATGATVISVLLGTSLAWLATRTNMPGSGKVKIITLLPFFTSSLLVGVSWSLLLSPQIGLLNNVLSAIGLPRLNIFSRGGLIWATGLYHTPYMFLFADSSLEESSQILGASTLNTLRRITIPIIAPSIASGALLVAVASVGLFGIAAILGTPGGIFVIPSLIHRQVSIYPVRTNVAAAIALCLVVFTFVLVAVQRRLLTRESKRFVTISGKASHARPVHLGKWRWSAAGFYWLFILIGIVLPYFVLIFASLSPFWSGKLSLGALTLTNYRELFFGIYGDQVRNAFRNSIVLALSAASLSVFICLIIAWVIHRGTGRLKVLAEFLATAPIAIPGIVFGLAFLWAWIRFPVQIYGTLWILIIAYLTRTMPHSVRMIGSNIIQISRDLEESARIMGASWTRTIRDIVFPLLKPGLIAAWAFVFILSIKELNTSILLVTPNTNVLSTLIYDIYQEGFYVTLSALVVVQSLLAFVTLTVFEYIVKGKSISER